MAIEVGDAVLTFLGDTTQLDAAFDKVAAEAPVKLEPTKVAIQDIDNSLQGMSTYFGQAGESAVVAGEEMSEAAKKAEFSMREAKGEMALLGEEIGVKVPRHIRGFVAELPGVGKALEAAFSATAALILIQILVEGTEKLANFIGEHFIFTEKMKEEEKAIVDLNGKLIEHNEKIKEITKTYNDFGLTGAQKIKADFEELNKAVKLNELALNDAANTLFKYNQGWGGTKEEAEKASNSLLLLTKIQQEQQIQMGLFEKQYDEALKQEQAARDNSKIQAAKIVGDSLIALREAQGKLAIANLKVNVEQEAAIEAAAKEQNYELELRSQQQRLAILQRDPTKNANQIRELNAQIEAAEEQHEAERLTKYADFLEKLKQLRQQKLDTIASDAPSKIEEDFSQLEALDKAFEQSGIQGSTQLYAALQRASEGYDTLKKSGIAAAGDLIRAQENLLRVQIQYESQFGHDTTQQQRQLQQLGEEYDKLVGHVDKSVSKINQLMRLYVQDVHNAGNQTKFFADIGQFALEDFAKAAGSAFDSFLQHQSSFGEAMKQATASTLDSIASMAFANALFYTAHGIADIFWNPPRAGADFASAAEFAALAAVTGAAGYALGSSASTGTSTGGTDTGPKGAAASSSANPAPQQNQRVQAFANGGLVTGPTMAILGDSTKDSGSQSEVALPLDDPEAVAKIKAALGGGGDTHIYHIGGMVSTDTMKKTMAKISSMTKRRQGQVVANNSYKLTKRG